MPNWSSQRAWKKLSKNLASKVERDFERAVLPCLRVLWPNLQQAPPKGAWDKKGIDLLTWNEGGPFACVVQCKGFEVFDLGYDQIRQARKSIDDFRRSGVQAQNYIFVHNRDGRARAFHNEIQEELNKLVQEGTVETAQLWHRQEMLDRVFDGMKERLNHSLRLAAQQILKRIERLFTFKLPYITMVPLTESKLTFERYKPCRHVIVRHRSVRNITNLLLSPSEARWTLFVGVFGAGKTTAALHAALSTETTPIFVQAATLSPASVSSSTNLLLEEVVKSLNILEDFDEQDLPVLEEISGSILGYLLRYPNSEYLFILDGLDENRMYSNLDGLQRLNNQLAEFSCPVILNTRKEHLNEMFGDFSSAFYELSSKYAPDRSARLLELESWDKSNVIEVLQGLLRNDDIEGKNHLQTFLSLVHSEEYLDFYGELPHNPLFLQFLLDDIVENGIRKANRTELLRSWIERKIRRDRTATKRVSPSDSLDTEDVVERMLLLLEKIASEMVTCVPLGFELTELIDSNRVTEIAKVFFPSISDSILPILLNSVLVPQGFRKGTTLNLFFAFRVFQEYFLASFLARESVPVERYPRNVAEFVYEIEKRGS